MSSFPGYPRLLKAAIVSLDILNPIPNVILLQYNPKKISRSFQPTSPSGEGNGNPSEILRLNGPPVETIDIDEIEIDASEQLEKPDQNTIAVQHGIYPQLSALEMILYPKSSFVIANTILAATGTLEITPPVGPLTLFIMGPKRVLPVLMKSLRIAEEEYDPNLNIVRATISLSFQVLSYNDLSILHPAHALSIANQVSKEVLATFSLTNTLSSTGVTSPI